MRGGDFCEVSSSSPAFRPAWSSQPTSSSFRWSSSSDRLPNVKCLSPYIDYGRVAWPCGKCPCCRATRRRIWTHRLILEALQHAENGFVTLTYRPEDLPSGGSLEPDHLQGWLRRLRRRIEPRRIRFYAVGEYGDKGGLPHYHAALFGLACQRGPVKLGPRGEVTCHCSACVAVRGSWTFGHTLLAELTDRAAAYIAGYVLKKMVHTSVPSSQKVPPFARMSLDPGIGADAVPDVASVMMRYRLEEKGDVPHGLRRGGSILPLGRYLRRKLRAQCGLPEDAPEEVIEALRQGLLPVFEYADAVCSHPTLARFKRSVAQEAFEEINRQENLNVQAVSKIRRGSL